MKESDIRPEHLLKRYMELSAADGDRLDGTRFVSISCPACACEDFRPRFTKSGFTFQNCQGCNSLFCSPRPTETQLMAFYETSTSSKYWSEVFFPAVAEIRREKIFRRKAKRIADLLMEKNLKPRRVCDVGAGYGLFLDELRPHFQGAALYAVEPDPKLAVRCRERGFQTVLGTADKALELQGKMDLVISSEVIEHVFSPGDFVSSLHGLLAPGGHCLISSLSYEGFDILTLQENSSAIHAPHHLNFLSVEGYETLFRNAGFTDIDVRTPGELDVDIVLNNEKCPEFLKVLKHRGEGALAQFQQFLVANRLSSHIWIFARKGS
jgi:SAM-dependent methyltransferase